MMVELKVKGYSYAYGNYGENKPEVYAFPEEEVREWARVMEKKLQETAQEITRSFGDDFAETQGAELLMEAICELARLAEGKEKGVELSQKAKARQVSPRGDTEARG